MKPSIVIVGTNHNFQAGHISYTAKQQADFSSFLCQIVRKYRIKQIAEEMSEDALPDYDVTETLAKRIANRRNICHAYVDLTAMKRDSIGIHGVSIHQTAQRSKLTPAQTCTHENLANHRYARQFGCCAYLS
jgi:hypothetical protein